MLLHCRRDPHAEETTLLADRDWEGWWQWALHYALWNMEMTDETKNAILNDKENKTPPSLTRRGMSSGGFEIV